MELRGREVSTGRVGEERRKDRNDMNIVFIQEILKT